MNARAQIDADVHFHRKLCEHLSNASAQLAEAHACLSLIHKKELADRARQIMNRWYADARGAQ